MIRERQAHPGKQEDILDRLLKTHEQDPEKLTFRQILAVTSINMYAVSVLLPVSLAIFIPS